MPTITLNVNTANSDANVVTYGPPAIDSSVRAEARRRLEAEDSKKAEEAAEIRRKAEAKMEAEETALSAERIRLRAVEEQARRMAERLVIEAEAKKAVLEKEAAVAREIDRLRNRSEVEVLRDEIAELKAQMVAMRSVGYRTSPW
jgi:hypothetical protein